MKTVKILLVTLILAISLPYSGKSQIISIDSKWIRFDSAAAVNVMQDIEVRESIIQLYADELTRADSVNTDLSFKVAAKDRNLKQLEQKYNNDITAEKKEKRLWQRIAIGASIAAFLLGVL